MAIWSSSAFAIGSSATGEKVPRPFQARALVGAGLLWVGRDWNSLCAAAAQSCLTLCDPMNCSPPGSSVHGISQPRMLEWVAISSFPGELPDPGTEPASPALQADSSPAEPSRKPPHYMISMQVKATPNTHITYLLAKKPARPIYTCYTVLNKSRNCHSLMSRNCNYWIPPTPTKRNILFPTPGDTHSTYSSITNNQKH